MKKNAFLHCLIVLLSAVAACLAGPTEMEPAGGNMLTRAGFHARKPVTPEQRLLYGVAPSYRMLRAGTPWQNFYVYKNETDGVAYVGDEVDYQRYRSLAAEEGYAHGFYHAQDMELDPAWRWSEAFGVRHVWTCRNRVELSAR